MLGNFSLKKNSFFKTPCTFCFESVDLPAPSACTMLAGIQCLSRRFFCVTTGTTRGKNERNEVPHSTNRGFCQEHFAMQLTWGTEMQKDKSN